MTSYWVAFVAALCVLGGGCAAPCDPCDPEPLIAVVPNPPLGPCLSQNIEKVPGTNVPYVVDAIEEALPCAPPCPTPCATPIINPPCDADGKPINLPTPLSFPIPIPPPLPSSCIFSILSQAQNGDPSAVLSQVSKFLASTLPCPHLQVAAAAAPPPQAPCDAPVVALSCNIPAPVTPPCHVPTPIPIAPPCNLPTPIRVPPPCNLPAPTHAAPTCNPPAPALAAAPCKNPSAPIVPTPTIQTPVSYLGPPSTIITPGAPKLEPVLNVQPVPVEFYGDGCGQPLDSASLVTLAALQQQANFGLTSPPAETWAQLNLAAPLPAATAPRAVEVAAPIFEFPKFGHATRQALQSWTDPYEPLSRAPYRYHHY